MNSNTDKLTRSWNALLNIEDTQNGWRTIPFAQSPGGLPFRAGVHFPEKTEAFLAGFSKYRPQIPGSMPGANGFELTIPEVPDSQGIFWLTLHRKPVGNRDMFVMMAGDILNILTGPLSCTDEETLFDRVIQRIKAWQKFMERPRERGLSREEEIGLWGELEILNTLLNRGVDPVVVLGWWTGPLQTLHDFSFPTGEIEVKTVSARSSGIEIQSLEQLDTTLASPLYLAICQFNFTGGDATLAEKILQTRKKLHLFPEAEALFSNRLSCYNINKISDLSSDIKIKFTEKKFFIVHDNFPRLERSQISENIQKCKYNIDINNLYEYLSDISSILESLKISVNK